MSSDLLPTAPYKVKEGQVLIQPDDEIWVRSTDDVRKLSSKILDRLNDSLNYIDVACIGPAALNQATKAIAVARDTLSEARIDLMVQPYFSTIEDENSDERTRMILRVTYLELAS